MTESTTITFLCPDCGGSVPDGLLVATCSGCGAIYPSLAVQELDAIVGSVLMDVADKVTTFVNDAADAFAEWGRHVLADSR